MRFLPPLHVLSLHVVAVLLGPAAMAAQGTAADYARAEQLRDRVRGAIVGVVDQSGWIDSTPRFWYRRTTSAGTQFVVVNADTREKRVAFDHQRLAAALAEALHRPVSGDSLPFATLTFTDGERALLVPLDTVRLRCTLTDYQCTRATARDGGRDNGGVGGALYGMLPLEDLGVRLSPDKRWEALVRNYNVYVRAAGSTENGVTLSYDGTEAEPYALRTLAWSPDSRKVAAYKVRPGYRREVVLVESSPEDQVQPRYIKRLYNKPGDVLDQGTAAVFDVASRRELIVDDALYRNAYNLTPLVWRRDSRAVTFEYNGRGHQVYRVIEVDAATGKARAVVDERSPTFFEYSAKKYAYDLGDGKEVVWMSERDGWNHLYLYDGATGRVKTQITRGPWVVRGVSRVDTAARQIWFSASGMEKGDPYFVHYYRIGIDGTGLTRLTDVDAMHAVIFSPDLKYYVDSWSRIDLPGVTQLRRTSDRSVVMELEKADASALYAGGWKAPESFVSRSRDGNWDIWGIIIRPSTFDPAKRYPVVENIYAGPHGSFVPKTFSAQLGMQAIAELGFIVVQIDGMGTSNRSKAFHDVAWKNLRDAGFPDRILWHRAVAAKYPYYDVSRVGIYGTSAGGQSTMAALLWHPEFYKVGVSAAGSHDNRMDKTWWNEQWMGWPIGPEYAANSNVDNAHLLQGKLLLLVGEMDRNVDPSSTMQVVNALIKAKKQFDLLVIPGADHTSGGDYGDLKRWDFFVHNLLGVEPPDRNATAKDAGAVHRRTGREADEPRRPQRASRQND
jgi:dipeptidyl aminopeptidase/acylaminoacyl peptidase